MWKIAVLIQPMEKILKSLKSPFIAKNKYKLRWVDFISSHYLSHYINLETGGGNLGTA